MAQAVGAAAKGVRKKKKLAKEIAVVHYEGCTGCEVCIDFCPVPNCILLRYSPEATMVNKVVEVVPELCIGCNLCAKYCPWETIDMVANPALAWERTSQAPAAAAAPA